MTDSTTSDHGPVDLSVAKGADGDRFEISVDGAVAGFAQYTERDGQRIFFHTVVDEAYAGRGLASALVRAALEATRADGLRVVAVCAYVAAWLRKHEGFEDLTDPVTPAALAAVESSGG